MRRAECGSDHHLLVAKIYLTYAATPVRKIQQDEQNDYRQQLKSWNIDSLQNDSTRFLYQFKLATNLSNMKNGLQEIYESLKRKIHEVEYEALGEKSHSNDKTHNPPWWTENLEEQIQKKKIASTKTQEDRKNYQKERGDATDAIERLQNEYWDKTCEEINNSMGNTRANKAWKIIEGLRTNNSTYRRDPRD
ncbi:hypothetical protein HHI36_018976 [Cryptolaemus montrouzieri]|uniref:Uncharacterized protein n=1 Tax=Cryptolaemus montrouzieri TaxID=559131 RepID=A0ABD2P1N5_9CUCU